MHKKGGIEEPYILTEILNLSVSDVFGRMERPTSIKALLVSNTI